MKRDTLQQLIVEDFERILGFSTRMTVLYHSLPDDERLNIQNHVLEWSWQVMMAAADPLSRVTDSDAAAHYKAFGGFVLNCQQGLTARFVTSDWIAMDRESYDHLKSRDPAAPQEGADNA